MDATVLTTQMCSPGQLALMGWRQRDYKQLRCNFMQLHIRSASGASMHQQGIYIGSSLCLCSEHEHMGQSLGRQGVSGRLTWFDFDTL